MAQLIHYHLTDTYSFSQIVGIDNTGILFNDGQSIFFEECALNFSRIYPEMQGKYIAECSESSEIPYFEFFTYGKSMLIRLDFLGKRTEQVFREFLGKLHSYGFKVYSLD